MENLKKKFNEAKRRQEKKRWDKQKTKYQDDRFKSHRINNLIIRKGSKHSNWKIFRLEKEHATYCLQENHFKCKDTG